MSAIIYVITRGLIAVTLISVFWGAQGHAQGLGFDPIGHSAVMNMHFDFPNYRVDRGEALRNQQLELQNRLLQIEIERQQQAIAQQQDTDKCWSRECMQSRW
jgi:hypothetical protein